jgi:peptidoglycan/LPS O-acetylase OafA/YrhL
VTLSERAGALEDSADRPVLQPQNSSTPRRPEPPSAAPAKTSETAKSGRGPMIASLTGIRALTASWIVVDHFRGQLFDLLPALRFLDPPLLAGYLRVEVFFVLSGFILAYNYAEKIRTGASYRRFLWARAARIYPLHITTTFIAVLLALYTPQTFLDAVGHDFPVNPSNLVANILNLQGILPFRGFDVPSWSLTCEMVAYLVFPALALLAVRLSPRLALLLGALVIAGGVVAINLVAGPGPAWLAANDIMWLRIGTDFTAGVLLCVWWRDRPRTSGRWDYVAIGCVVTVFVLSYCVPGGSPATFLALPVIALLLVAIASASGPVARLLASRPMQWGGKLSYSLYLGHCIAQLIVEQILPSSDYHDTSLAVRIGWLLMTVTWILAIAIGLHYGVEEPARKRMLAWYARGEKKRAARVPCPE